MPDLIETAVSQTTTVDGLSIHYKVLGDTGPAVLLVHGGGCDMTFWTLQVEALAAGRQVLLIDLPGHGQSDSPPDIRYSMELHAKAMDAVFSATGVDQAIVVGHSLGGPALRMFHRLFPGRVRAMIILDGAVIYQAMGLMFNLMKLILNGPLYGIFWPPMVNAFTSRATPQWGSDKVNASMKNAPRYVVRSFYPEMLHEDSALKDPLPVPLLCIYADSPAWTAEIQQRIRALSQQVELVMVPGVSHFLMLDKPDEINELLVNFCRKYEED